MDKTETVKEITEAIKHIDSSKYVEGNFVQTKLTIPVEMSLTIYVNNIELVSIMCTPHKLNSLVLGFLFSEGIISGISDISLMRICIEDALADVRLIRQDFQVPQRKILTSGCGGGTSFNLVNNYPVTKKVIYTAEQIYESMKKMQDKAELFKLGKGVHTSALSNGSDLVAIAEDVGRHNTIDKLTGDCLLNKLNPSDFMLITTGRISAEMINKVTRVGIPVVVSRSTGTSRAIEMADTNNITLIAYVRGKRFDVCTHLERIII